MLTIALLAHEINILNDEELSAFYDLAVVLRGNEVNVIQTSGEVVTNEFLQSQHVDAIVATGGDLEIIKRLVSQFPMTNYALVSSESQKDFHEMTEGFGIFMQLPVSPGKNDVLSMLDKLRRIKALTHEQQGVEA